MFACSITEYQHRPPPGPFAAIGVTHHLDDQSVDVCKRASWEGGGAAPAAAGTALRRAVRGDDRGSVIECGTGRSGRAVEGCGTAIPGKRSMSAGAREALIRV